MTVYITQEARGRDFSDALQYGDLELLTKTDEQNNISTSEIISKIKERLKKFKLDDYLLLSGDPAIIGIAFVLAARLNRGKVNILKWDRLEERYYPVSIDFTNIDMAESFLSESENHSNAPKEVELCAICICGKEKKMRTVRNIKNAWPICSCSQPMTVKPKIPQFIDK